MFVRSSLIKNMLHWEPGLALRSVWAVSYSSELQYILTDSFVPTPWDCRFYYHNFLLEFSTNAYLYILELQTNKKPTYYFASHRWSNMSGWPQTLALPLFEVGIRMPARAQTKNKYRTFSSLKARGREIVGKTRWKWTTKGNADPCARKPSRQVPCTGEKKRRHVGPRLVQRAGKLNRL